MGRNVKKPYGVFNAETEVKYCIVLLFKGGTKLRFVTDVSYSPKEFQWTAGKQAKFWDRNCREIVEELATAMNCNGYPAFVMTVPGVFRYEDFVNPEKEETKEETNG